MIETAELKKGAINFLEEMRIPKTWNFKFCSENNPTLIGSCLAAMLGNFIGYFDKLTKSDKKNWANYIKSFQRKDGWFEDEDIAEKNLSPGYLKDRALLHRTRHALFALYALEERPLYKFYFLENWLGKGKMRKWCETLNLSDYWYSSNVMMDIAIFLMDNGYYNKNERSWQAVEELLNFCDENVNTETGFHDKGISEIRNAMAGAMHLYPVYFLMKRPVKKIKETIQTTVSLQQPDGLFGYESGKGGEDCLDYDAVFILANLCFTNKEFEAVIKESFLRCLKGIMVCKNPDGGFSCHRRNETYFFGTKTTVVPTGKSSLWATYSRLLTIAMMMNILYPETRSEWKMGANLMEIWDGGTGIMQNYPPSRLRNEMGG